MSLLAVITIIGAYLLFFMKKEPDQDDVSLRKYSLIKDRDVFNRDCLDAIYQNKSGKEMIFELHGEYDIDKKELEIQTKKKENFRLIALFLLLCLTIMIISVPFWKGYKIKNKLPSEIQMKEDILRVISHDLLSPLNSLEMMVQENLENASIPGSDFHKSFLIQQKYIQNTKVLCHNLVNWLWADTIGKEYVCKTKIKDSMERILAELEPFLKAYDCNTILLVKLEAGNDYRLDLNAFNVVFRNLLTNSIRHAKATEVQIALNDHDGELYLRIYDNGIAVDENIKKEIETYVNGNSESDFGRLGSYLVKVFLAKINGQFCFENPKNNNFSNLQTVIVKLK